MRSGFAKIGAGLYVDSEGGLYVVVGEILLAHGYADTPENREMLGRTMREMLPLAHVSEAA